MSISPFLIGESKILLKKHEGFRSKPYKCTAGKLTIGYGRNIEDNGITVDEALFLLENDIKKTIDSCNSNFSWFKDSSSNVQLVVVNMVFNMGLNGFKKFKKTINLIENKEYKKASIEMLNSHWAKQVKGRALELSELIKKS